MLREYLESPVDVSNYRSTCKWFYRSITKEELKQRWTQLSSEERGKLRVISVCGRCKTTNASMYGKDVYLSFETLAYDSCVSRESYTPLERIRRNFLNMYARVIDPKVDVATQISIINEMDWTHECLGKCFKWRNAPGAEPSKGVCCRNNAICERCQDCMMHHIHKEIYNKKRQRKEKERKEGNNNKRQRFT